MSAASKFFGKHKHMRCFAHLLNLVVDYVLTYREPKEQQPQNVAQDTCRKYLSQLIGKVRAIVKWVKGSVIVTDELKKLQLKEGVAEGNIKKLILDVKTLEFNFLYVTEVY